MGIVIYRRELEMRLLLPWSYAAGLMLGLQVLGRNSQCARTVVFFSEVQGIYPVYGNLVMARCAR